MSEEELKIMDWRRFIMFTDGDPDESKELIDLFVEHAEESIKSICTLCSSTPDEQWKSAVHKLKGSSANLGAEILAKHCKVAELKWEESYTVKQAIIEEIIEQYSLLRDLLAKPVLKLEEWE